MKSGPVPWRRLLVAAGAVLFVLLGPACSFDTSGIGPTSRLQTCTAEVWHCPTTAGSVSLTVRAAGANAQVANYQVVPDLWKDKGRTYHPYYDSPIAISAVGSPDAKGATLVVTGATDWKINAPAFLQVELLTDAAALYVAYDSRVAPPPWLASGYSKQPGTLALSKKDPATSLPLTMDLWRLNGDRRRGEVITIPGNFSGVTQAPPKAPLMYVVLVQPTSTVDCATAGTRVGTFTQEQCPDPANADLRPAVLRACNLSNPGLICRAESCQSSQRCTPTNTGRGSWPVKSYRVGSRVEFVPPSRIDATIRGQSASADVTGTLGFSYDGDLTTLVVDDLILKAGAIATDEGPFEDTTMVLWSAAAAGCVGGPGGFAQPCDDYRIAAGGLQVSVTTRFQGEDLLWLGESVQPIDVHIDQTARTFQFAGTLQVEITVNGEQTSLSATLDLHGYIADVAPTAVGTLESDLVAECVEDRNDRPLVLNAGGSFDVYAPSPTNLAGYEWYEDFGLATQHSWGTGLQTVIPRGALGFGSHQITLVVADQDGMVDTDTFDLQVVDTVPPVFSAPPQDVTTDIHPAGTEMVAVDLGAASARDACSPQVLLSHDGPEDGRFTPGVHTVTWTAEDARGNTTEVVQRVDVRVLARRFAWWWVMGPAAVAGAGLVWGVVARARGRSRRRRDAGVSEPGEAPPPPPPPPPTASPVRWFALGAGVLTVAAATAVLVLLLHGDEGGSAAGTSSTSQPFVTTTGPPGTGTSTTVLPTTTGNTTSTVPTTTTTAGTSTSTTAGTTSTTSSTTTTATTTTSTTLPGPTLDPFGPPTYGDTKLITGFLTDPAPYSITAGGPVALSSALPGRGCPGWAAANPDLQFDWVGSGLLRFYFLPDDPGADTVLVIYDPSGNWQCVDDSYGGVHPTVDFNPSQNGLYEIWVGTYEERVSIPGTLFVTELDANHP